ncbi:unnamed protein product [Linum trigynum]|uniref:RRM domain-containing protein n=1 Tax=Linum trigynum TaxID=586398 RepID=A0AAV2EMY3_9ROSI
MESSLDMNLDDIVRQNKSRGKGRSGRRGKGGVGPNRRFGGRGILGPSPYLLPSVPATRNFFGKASMELVEPMLVPADGRGEGTKLYVSNLDYGVTSQDIKVLFSEVGKLKRYSIHCDESGRPKGTAEVVYERYGDALAAIMRYDNVDLDGRPLRIELIGVKVLPPTPLRAPAAASNTRRPNLPFNFKSGGGESFRGRRPAHGGDSFGKDKGPGGAQCQVQVQGEEIVWGQKLTAEELDAAVEIE